MKSCIQCSNSCDCNILFSIKLDTAYLVQEVRKLRRESVVDGCLIEQTRHLTQPEVAGLHLHVIVDERRHDMQLACH